MDSQTDTEMALRNTPAKADREGAAGFAGISTPGADEAMRLSSPAIRSFARKNPPALSSKPRKATSLFGDPASDAAKKFVGDGNAPSRTYSGMVDRNTCGGSLLSHVGGGHPGAPHHEDAAKDHGQRGGGCGGGSGDGGGDGVGACFISPTRLPREACPRDRFTPQRNLGGLFASPLPPQRDDASPVSFTRNITAAADAPVGVGVSNNSTLVVPRKLQSPREGQSGEAISRPEAVAAPAPAPETAASVAAADADADADAATTATAISAVADVEVDPTGAGREERKCAHSSPLSPGAFASEEDSWAPAYRCHEERSVPTNDICVSNEALRSNDSEAMCTVEVLVKHTRERVGVSALASWRVAELKRRLVYLNLFASPEAIALVPRFGGAALEDDVALGTLDVDVTYEARAAAAVA